MIEMGVVKRAASSRPAERETAPNCVPDRGASWKSPQSMRMLRPEVSRRYRTLSPGGRAEKAEAGHGPSLRTDRPETRFRGAPPRPAAGENT